MRKWIVLLYCFCTAACLVISCGKEFSVEGLPAPYLAKGSLQDSLGNCRGIAIIGTYTKDSVLGAGNYVTVNAGITAAGKYLMYTDTVNGCWFLDSGTVTGTGRQSFTLSGYGRPASPVFGEFTVHFCGTVCGFAIPTGPAVYTFNATPASCPNINVGGRYLTGAVLNAADTVTIPVRVTVPGRYSIQTAVQNGMAFSAQGIFTSAGNINITLTGTGYPAFEGTTAIPVTINSTTCTFAVNVLLDTSMYWQFTAEGINYKEYLRDSVPPITPFNFAGYTDKIYELNIANSGVNTTRSYLSMGMCRVNHPFTTGIYTGGAPFPHVKDFEGGLTVNLNQFTPGGLQYSYQCDTSLHGFFINVFAYDPVSGLVEGAFSGPVYKVAGTGVDFTNAPVVNMADGYFKAYLAH